MDKISQVCFQLDGITILRSSIGPNGEKRCYIAGNPENHSNRPLRVIYHGKTAAFICEDHYTQFYEKDKQTWTTKWKLYE
jgi:hypothetical protein